MSQYTMQYGGGAGTGRAGSLLTPLLPRIAVGATHSSTLWHGSREQAMLCRVCETHQGRRQYSLKPVAYAKKQITRHYHIVKYQCHGGD